MAMEEIKQLFEVLGVPKIAAALILMALAGFALAYSQNFFGLKNWVQRIFRVPLPVSANLEIEPKLQVIQMTLSDGTKLNLEDLFLFLKNIGQETIASYAVALRIKEENGDELFNLQEELKPFDRTPGYIPAARERGWRVYTLITSNSEFSTGLKLHGVNYLVDRRFMVMMSCSYQTADGRQLSTNQREILFHWYLNTPNSRDVRIRIDDDSEWQTT